jgi:hypothetical protein
MSLGCSNTCPPSSLRHVWSHKKVLHSRYYDILVSNVILSRFQRNWSTSTSIVILFTRWRYRSMIGHLYWGNMRTMFFGAFLHVFKILITYEPQNTCGSRHLCTLVLCIVWHKWGPENCCMITIAVLIVWRWINAKLYGPRGMMPCIV